MIHLLLLIWCAYSDGFFLDEIQKSGYITIEGENKYFYWLFKSRDYNSTAPLLLWFTGGPGCSSIEALFTENGPFNVSDDLKLIPNQYSWNSKADLVFIDQPIGTGFSVGKKYATSGEDYGDYFYKFIINFMEKYPEYQGRPLYISGESYAGHYIPLFAYYLIQNNHPYINLKGLAIGNGLVYAPTHYSTYAKYAYANGLIKSRFVYGILDTLSQALKTLAEYIIYPIAFIAEELIKIPITGFPFALKFNMYDIRQKCEHPVMCYDFDKVYKYLNSAEVQQHLGVNMKWESCNTLVFALLLGDYIIDSRKYVTAILEKNIPMLFYNGDKDFMVNWMGSEKWIEELKWEHAKEYNNQSYQYKVLDDGHAYAVSKTYGPLSFWRVFDAGHMVPMNQPKFSQALIEFLMGYNKFL